MGKPVDMAEDYLGTPLLTAAQVSVMLAVSQPTIYRLADCGALKVFRIGASVRFSPRDVNAYLAANYTGRPSVAVRANELPPSLLTSKPRH